MKIKARQLIIDRSDELVTILIVDNKGRIWMGNGFSNKMELLELPDEPDTRERHQSNKES